MAKSLRGIASVVSLCCLAGCSWSDVLLEQAKSVPRTASFSYEQGYLAGCKTGVAQTGGLGFDKPNAVRDDARMKSEADYKTGWEAGQRTCTDRYSGLVLRRKGLDK